MSNLSEAETRTVLKAVRRVVSERFGGNTLLAERKTGVNQYTIWRLLHEPPRCLRRSTFDALARAEPALRGLIMTSRAQRAWDDWQAWVDRRLKTTSQAVPMLQRLDQGSASWRELENFKEWARKWGHSERRIAVAIGSALEPLYLAALATCGLERHWGELAPEEQARYLRVALARERIILTREPEDDRARAKYPAEPVTVRLAARLRWLRAHGRPDRLSPARQARKGTRKHRRMRLGASTHGVLDSDYLPQPEHL